MFFKTEVNSIIHILVTLWIKFKFFLEISINLYFLILRQTHVLVYSWAFDIILQQFFVLLTLLRSRCSNWSHFPKLRWIRWILSLPHCGRVSRDSCIKQDSCSLDYHPFATSGRENLRVQKPWSTLGKLFRLPLMYGLSRETVFLHL